MTDEQALTLARLMRDFKATNATVTVGPCDLPTGYVLVDIYPSGARSDQSGPPNFVAGIAPTGEASS